MDPKACLDQASSHINHGEYDDALNALQIYYRWRAKGGFEPIMGDGTLGDAYHDRLTNQIVKALP